MKLRKLILKIHLYGGLLCFWYLIIYAVSSLHFQHHFEFMNPVPSEETFEKKLKITPNDDINITARNIQDEIGVAGWHLPWATRIDKNGLLHTEIQNPDAQYLVTWDNSTSTVKYIKKKKGFWAKFNSLHGFSGKMPNAPLMIIWGVFTYISLIVVTFAIFSGIWLWMKGSTYKLVGAVTASVIVIISLSLMIYVYFHG